MDAEAAVRRAKGLAAFQSFSKAHQKLTLAHKMRLYRSNVVPCFLYGTEAGNWTAAHMNMLQAAHTACLRHIIGVSMAERHTRCSTSAPPVTVAASRWN
jgi:hypothetical protein